MSVTRGVPGASATLDAYGEQAREQHLAPLWEFFKEWFSAEPRVDAVPYLWQYDRLRPLLMEAASVIGTEEAERRVLALENPGLAGRRLVTDSLYAGLQLIVPGEIAPSHRHSAAALRFILEGRGGYTCVEGEKAAMSEGDLIVTPSWSWHEHGNAGTEPTIWMDVLDVPLIRFLGAGFSEHYPERQFPRLRPQGDSLHRFAMNMRPVNYAGRTLASPVFCYPYERTREVLDRLKRASEWDPHHALKMEYVDPTTGGPAIPTISTFMQLVPAGFSTKRFRTTAGTIHSVVEGRGQVRIASAASDGDELEHVLDYARRDIWSLPSWQFIEIEAIEDSIIFSASDEAVQRKLGVWREQRGD